MLSEVGSSQEISQCSPKKIEEEQTSLDERFEDMLKKNGITDPCEEL